MLFIIGSDNNIKKKLIHYKKKLNGLNFLIEVVIKLNNKL